MNQRAFETARPTTGSAVDARTARAVARATFSRAGLGVALAAAAIAAVASGAAQSEERDTWSTCAPVAERAGRALGCYIVARQTLSQLPEGPLYWHLDVYPTRAAAEKAKGTAGTIVESYGEVWLFTVAGANWRASGAKHVADVGPLPLDVSGEHTAVYMEATSTPGMQSAVHRHPGPEAWYVLAGEQCLETPDGTTIVRAGETGIVRAGPPMRLTTTGTDQRRSLVLVLHDASQHWASPATDWTPKGLCGR
jgi:quercetin dioxygenase-like cupin family protein